MLLWILFACLMGVAVCLQGATNGSLGARIGVPATVAINSSVVFVAAVTIWWFAPAFGADEGRSSGPQRGWPVWLFLGGVYGLVVLGLAAWLFPRLGAGPTMALMVTAQLVTGLVLDHLGWPADPLPVSPVRVVGVLLLMAGTVLVLWPRLRG